MTKKIHLETRQEPTLFTLIGISCHDKDYRLSFLLNQHLGLALVKMDDLPVSASSNHAPDSFSLYFCEDEDHYNVYYLLINRGQDTFLFPTMKQTDFFLLIEGPFKKNQKDQILSRIKGVPNVLTGFEINFSSLKNFETLLTELELHCSGLQREAKLKFSPIKNMED